jgi:hypothetical protein
MENAKYTDADRKKVELEIKKQWEQWHKRLYSHERKIKSNQIKSKSVYCELKQPPPEYTTSYNMGRYMFLLVFQFLRSSCYFSASSHIYLSTLQNIFM